jgi:hypothetical protein
MKGPSQVLLQTAAPFFKILKLRELSKRIGYILPCRYS